MITVIEALIAGLVQGVTEFLPVSSSGHLVLVHRFFGQEKDLLLFDIWLHAATLLAIIFFFRKDIVALFRGQRTAWLKYIVVATIPAVLVGLALERHITGLFTAPKSVGAMLLITSFFLFSAEASLRYRKKPNKEMNFLISILVGIAQASALMPGISRSGSTISTGIVSGMERRDAFSFSFLLSIPIVMGALLYKTLTTDVGLTVGGNAFEYFIGAIVAFVAALFSLRILWLVIKNSKLYIFALYCLFLGMSCLIIF